MESATKNEGIKPSVFFTKNFNFYLLNLDKLKIKKYNIASNDDCLIIIKIK